jgi:catechol 2,3-dioxygenase-like lactoylglutathione lyase family enzyme
MSGELDLSVLIASMQPVLHPDEYVFCTVTNEQENSLLPCVMRFQEAEGTTVIIKKSEAERAKLSFIYPSKMITLNVHSSLDAIGFLAAIAKHLAAAGISMNAVSAFYHDHLFVPTDKAAIAQKLLIELSKNKSSFSYNDLIPEFGVSNFKQSIRFYTEILPFKIEYDRPEKGFAFLSLRGSQLMIEQLAGTTEATAQELRDGNWRTGTLEFPFGRGASLSINVDSLDLILKNLSDAKHPLKMEPKEAWYRRGEVLVGERQILVMDPDGYLLRFQESLGVKAIPPA